MESTTSLDFLHNATPVENLCVGSVLESSCTGVYTQILCSDPPSTFLTGARSTRSLLKFTVQVVYGLAHKQSILDLTVSPGTTVIQAIEQSHLLSEWPDLNLQSAKLGIFGTIVSPDTPVKNNDRIEIYRPLTIDPKEARRLKARKHAK